MDGVTGWMPNDPCPCPDPRCDAVALKLNRYGHAKNVCVCRSCVGRRAREKGQRHQSRALKSVAAAIGQPMPTAPTHEEWAHLGLHYEVKSGAQIPVGMRGDRVKAWEKQAKAACSDVPLQDWVLVLEMPDGRRRAWLDFDALLRLVEGGSHG